MRNSAKIGLLGVAMALLGGGRAQDYDVRLGRGQDDYSAGLAIKYSLDNAYRRAHTGKPSRAAHFKRLAKKRRNMRARSAK